MRPILSVILCFMAWWLTLFSAQAAEPARSLPQALKDWVEWATWDDLPKSVPAAYDQPAVRLPLWPSVCVVKAGATGAEFSVEVTACDEVLLTLPGTKDIWPVKVKMGGIPVPVVEHELLPCVRLMPGTHRIEGVLPWMQMPESLLVPENYGVISLWLEGKLVEFPSRDASGRVWLKRRVSAGVTDNTQDNVSSQTWRLLEDGNPTWLRTQVELSVSGKPREESLGSLIPEGWQVSAVRGPLPVVVDAQGVATVRVRPGRFKIEVDAFRTDSWASFSFAPGVRPGGGTELVAVKPAPDFRVIEVPGLPTVDGSQVQFPEAWKQWPIYAWETGTAFAIVEKLRGMGIESNGDIQINRVLWLDEDGRSLTWRDTLSGNLQKFWRLDCSPQNRLGSVRMDGEPQLVTLNPVTGAPGFEVRTRTLSVEAVGRADSSAIAASGWQVGADGLQMVFHLPPGWRTWAVLGADRSTGDWITHWTLLDLFLVMVGALAVFRVWGWQAGLVTFVALGLAWHEPGAPRYSWLALMAAVVVERAVPQGLFRQVCTVLRYGATVVLLWVLIPFCIALVQGALYPQLENSGGQTQFVQRGAFMAQDLDAAQAALPAAPAPMPVPAKARKMDVVSSVSEQFYQATPSAAGMPQRKKNLAQEPKAKVQTGPGVPEWSWGTPLVCSWDGPVAPEHQVVPLWMPPSVQRPLSVIRALLLLGLLALLLDLRRCWNPLLMAARKTAPAVVLLAAVFWHGQAVAQGVIPDKPTLETLRERVLQMEAKPSKLADLAFLEIIMLDGKVTLDAEWHAITACAVPLPGGLPEWAPVSVTLDGARVPLLRKEHALWISLPQGIHKAHIEAALPGVQEWRLSLPLKPRSLSVRSDEWTVSGLDEQGLAEGQLFFSKKQRAVRNPSLESERFEKRDYQSLVRVRRVIELGLVWKVSTTVERFTPAGAALSLELPLLAGEKVLSAQFPVESGRIRVRMSERESQVSWESSLDTLPKIELHAAQDARWVEQWRLEASPIWNVTLSGLEPVFEKNASDLTPVWNPWPGETIAMEISRPEQVAGPTMTVHRAQHEMQVGRHHRASTLALSVQSSTGEDFPITIGQEGEGIEIERLSRDGHDLPIRLEKGKLIVPLHPGSQELEIRWKSTVELGFWQRGDAVKLPVAAANITTKFHIPESRWTLWASGPVRGPAVRLWVILLCALVAAWFLSRLPSSPLGSLQWMLLSVGLTQVHFVAALVIATWFFLLLHRGKDAVSGLTPWLYNLRQLALVFLTFWMLGSLVQVVGVGLLGDPEMWIGGEDSSAKLLSWYQPTVASDLPVVGAASVSIWFYRVLMLVWALWLAHSMVEWIRWAWSRFSVGGLWKTHEKKNLDPEAIPPVVQ